MTDIQYDSVDTVDIATAIEDLCNLAYTRNRRRPWHRKICRFLLRYAGGRSRASFYKSLSLYRQRDIDISEALVVMYANHTDDGRSFFGRIGPLGVMIPDWLYQQTEEGRETADIAHYWLPHLEAQLIGVYGETGLPAKPLRVLANEVKQMAAWARKTRRDLVLPVLSLLLTVGTILWVALIKFPALLKMGGGRVRLQGTALTAINLSDWLVHWGWAVPIVTAAIIGGFIYSLPNWHRRLGGVRQALDDFYPYSLYRDYTSIGFLDALGSLMIAGRDEHAALEALLENQSPYVSAHIRALLELINYRTADALYVANRNWPARAHQRTIRTLAVGSQTGPGLKEFAVEEKGNFLEKLSGLSSFISISIMLLVFGVTIWVMELMDDIMNSIGVHH